MDTRWTSGEVARSLGTSVARVLRAVPGLSELPSFTAGGHVRFTLAQVKELTSLLGTAPEGTERSREELFVLAALIRRPLGLRSTRAVAAAAGVSPTTATKLLFSLEKEGLVMQVEERVIEGRPVLVKVWKVNRASSDLRALRPGLRLVRPPRPRRPRRSTSDRLPRRLWHNFWNADPAALRLSRDGTYIAGRLLNSNDPQSLAWLLTEMNPETIVAASQMRGVDPARKALAQAAAER